MRQVSAARVLTTLLPWLEADVWMVLSRFVGQEVAELAAHLRLQVHVRETWVPALGWAEMPEPAAVENPHLQSY